MPVTDEKIRSLYDSKKLEGRSEVDGVLSFRLVKS